MIPISNTTKIFIAKTAISFRTRIDGTAAACHKILKKDPLSGALFLFTNRSQTMIRAYYFDGHGEWLIEKRAMTGKFRWWQEASDTSYIDPAMLGILFRGGDVIQTKLPQLWKNPLI